MDILFLLPFVASLGISFIVSAYCWQRRNETGSQEYAIVAFGQALWTLGYIFELISNSLNGKIFWDNFQFIGGVLWLVSFIAFTVNYIGWQLSRPWLVYSLLSIPGILIVVLAYTDPWHGLLRPHAWLVNKQPFSALLYDFTNTLMLWGIYGILILITCLSLLLVEYKNSPQIYRIQVLLILTGNIIPALGIVLTMTGAISGAFRDISPFTFALGNLVVFWGLFQYRLFDIVPLAWNNVIENMSDFVVILDAQNRIVNLNKTARRISGLESVEDIIGLPGELVFSEWMDKVNEYREIKETHTEMTIAIDSKPMDIDLRIQPLYDQHKRFKGRVIIIRDISDRKKTENELRMHRDNLEKLVKERTTEIIEANLKLQQQINEKGHLEERLRQSQKLEALGSLAGGIAHDFNNMLVPILGYAELGLGKVKSARLQKYFSTIKKASEKASDLVSQILAFSRQQVLEIKVYDLNKIINEFDVVLERLIREDTKVETLFNSDTCLVWMDKVQIEQMLMNLVVNARDAMPKGGEIGIKTEIKYLDSDFVKEHGNDLKTADYVLLTVTDTGHGIEREIKERIFDPFFSTKKSEGTGLGLATVFGIIKQHQGCIEVDSSPGKGTTFRIYLPKAENQPEAVRSQESDPKTLKGTESILVVEDEEIVRNFVCETLEMHGYNIIRGKTPADCIKIIAEKAPIHLLLTDVIMPDLNGRELYSKLRAIQPNIKVLYISGYSNDVIVHHGVLEEGIQLLQKPFTIGTLARRVRQVLDS